MNQDKKDYIKSWLFRAREDLAAMNTLAESEMDFYTSTICFHAQQAVEKYLKAYLVNCDVDFPKTHDVDYLIEECRRIDDQYFEIDLKSLTEFGVSVRYPDDLYIPGIEETKEYVEIANQVGSLIESLLGN